MAKRKFLEAKWNNLLMLNYEVEPAILKQYIPPGTELDLWQGKALVSMVGFLFKETKVLGVKWPFHVNFEEVNLRFYVRYFDGNAWKRGAVFVSEIVPKSIIALIANKLYNENYRALRMRHSLITLADGFTNYTYEWKLRGRWNMLSADVSDDYELIKPGSAEEFIFEHYWGYNKVSEQVTMEYQVEHITWQTASVKNPVFDADIPTLYGKAFEPYLTAAPYSAFFADGSDVNVRIFGKL